VWRILKKAIIAVDFFHVDNVFLRRVYVPFLTACSRGPGSWGMATGPGRHHASRRSSNVQAMAYTMATNRHITPKPGQGWRVWAE
jgi:hypothetical protein